jgi:hypothetical protein
MVVGHHHEFLWQLLLTPAYVIVCHYYILSSILFGPFNLKAVRSHSHQVLIHLALAYTALPKVGSVIFLGNLPGMPSLR